MFYWIRMKAIDCQYFIWAPIPTWISGSKDCHRHDSSRKLWKWLGLPLRTQMFLLVSDECGDKWSFRLLSNRKSCLRKCPRRKSSCLEDLQLDSFIYFVNLSDLLFDGVIQRSPPSSGSLSIVMLKNFQTPKNPRTILLMLLVVCLNGTVLLEQPANSILEYYPRFRDWIQLMLNSGGKMAVSWQCFWGNITHQPSYHPQTWQDSGWSHSEPIAWAFLAW